MRTTQNRRRLAAAVLVLATTGALAACGASDEGDKSTSKASASDATPDFEQGAKLTADEAHKVLDDVIKGTSTARYAVSIEPAGGSEAIEGSGSGEIQMDPLSVRATGTVTQDGETMDLDYVVLGEDEIYSKVEGEWAKNGLAALTVLALPPASTVIEATRAAIEPSSTVYVGQESIDGVDAAHYTFTSGEESEAGTEEPVDFYVGSGDRLMRVFMNLEDIATITYDLSHHGEKVTIEKPDGEITDMTDMDLG
ncbi:hypothetical protein OG984_01820 [Nocardioides sp. NBC_00368]|uniref:hypothetical protein n=1 Tax=Nocardioides sp. NBC_00368 TaxID=2976000 RepID=UPI002E2167C4